MPERALGPGQHRVVVGEDRAGGALAEELAVDPRGAAEQAVGRGALDQVVRARGGRAGRRSRSARTRRRSRGRRGRRCSRAPSARRRRGAARPPRGGRRPRSAPGAPAARPGRARRAARHLAAESAERSRRASAADLVALRARLQGALLPSRRLSFASSRASPLSGRPAPSPALRAAARQAPLAASSSTSRPRLAVGEVDADLELRPRALGDSLLARPVDQLVALDQRASASVARSGSSGASHSSESGCRRRAPLRSPLATDR